MARSETGRPPSKLPKANSNSYSPLFRPPLASWWLRLGSARARARARHMGRERLRWPAAAAAAALLLVLSAASHDHPHGSGRGGTESSFQNNEQQSFGFNITLAKTIVEYASAVYMTDLTALYKWTCSKCNDLIQGFEMRCIIVDVHNCLQAFVGIDHGLNAIIVSIRGTQENSVQNWIKDMLWKQEDLNYPSMPNAKVHTGFYSSYNNTLLRPAIANAVRKARELNGDMNIIVTGHSMGGALASFCALDLAITHGGDNVFLTTFGQPRVGNAAFASYFAKYVPNTIRVTHEHDIVPHLPPYFFIFPDQTYHHFPREVWEHEVDGNTIYQVCDDSGEDTNCCRSVSVLSWSASDHLTYLGVDMEADDWSSCRIVLGRSVQEYLFQPAWSPAATSPRRRMAPAPAPPSMSSSSLITMCRLIGASKKRRVS